MACLKGQVIYHCGPLMKGLKVVSAGPTTSARMSVYIRKILKTHSTPAIIGKGGLSKEATDAMKGRAVYLSAVGGAGSLYASKIVKVKNVFKKHFGMAEAIYEFEVTDFPLLVSIDSRGNNIYEKVEKKSRNIHPQ